MHKVFISYSTDDKVWTYELWRAIRDRLNWEVWIDQKLIPATDWWVSICESIKGCDIFIIVLSPKSVASKYCTAELGYAVALNKPIIPLMLKPCHYPTRLGRRQYEKITDGMPLGDVLLSISNTANKITFDRGQGQYEMPDGVKAPDEPLGDLHELLAQAQAALEASNFDLAEQFCHKVIQADPDVMGAAAEQLLTQIATARRRQTAYENVRAVLSNPQLAQTAPVAWQRLVERYGAEPDPDGLAERVAKLIVPPPPEPPVQPPAPPKPPTDPVQAALQRARDFTKSGKRNRDWTPFITTFSDLKIPNMPFCLVPTGTFRMGSDTGYDDEKPVHFQSFTEPFYIAQYPVTNAQWRVAVKAGVVGEPKTEKSKQWYDDPKMANAPVVGVTWFEAQKFAQWAGCRLLTEREWEYAARGVENWVYPWGDDWDADKAIYYGNSGGKPWDVTSKPDGASWVGAQHLSGNVWEWTASLYQDYPYPTDGSREVDTGDRTDVRRILRGGSFGNTTYYLRASNRYRFTPYVEGYSIGFRCARSQR
jgi:formylglycine-generating enzyme required for sulfatase activity